MSKPNIADYPEYFRGYVDLVPEDDFIEALQNQGPVFIPFLKSIPQEKSIYAYAEGKWSLKKMLQHITDAERIFNYRALCISRKEIVSLPGFDENMYADNSNADARSWQSLVDEFINVRRSTQDLYFSFTEDMLNQKGLSNNNNVANVLSFGFVTVGHVYHHKKIIEERYLA